MEENFYVRGDGTRVYFFEQDELRHIWGGDAAVEGKGGKKEEEEEEEGTEKEHDGHDDDASLAQQAQNLAVVVDGANGNGNGNGHHAGPRPAFDVAHFGVDRRMLVNRQRRLKMYRCWMQAVFRKPGSDVGVQSNVPTSTLRQETKQEEEEVGQEGEGEGEA
jgi:tRNAThr (cytosine32-N3)-methyltransferase